MSDWRRGIVLVAVGIAAAIHLAPGLGILGPVMLERLYGVALQDPALVLLMQHRAVLFALVGTGLLLALRWASWRLPMLIAALVSMVSFVLIAGWPSGDWPAALVRVWWVDVAVAPLVSVGCVLLVASRRREP